jgi:hypothetical protein
MENFENIHFVFSCSGLFRPPPEKNGLISSGRSAAVGNRLASNLPQEAPPVPSPRGGASAALPSVFESSRGIPHGSLLAEQMPHASNVALHRPNGLILSDQAAYLSALRMNRPAVPAQQQFLLKPVPVLRPTMSPVAPSVTEAIMDGNPMCSSSAVSSHSVLQPVIKTRNFSSPSLANGSSQAASSTAADVHSTTQLSPLSNATGATVRKRVKFEEFNPALKLQPSQMLLEKLGLKLLHFQTEKKPND